MKEKLVKDSNSMVARASTQIGWTFRNTLLSKGAIISLFFLMIPAYIAAYTLFDPPPDIKEWPGFFIFIGLYIYLQLLVLIFSLIYGSSMVNEEIDRKTMTYLITKGSKRFEVLIYKYTGTLSALSVMFFISIIITFILFGFHTRVDVMADRIEILISLLVATFLGLAAYLAIFSFFGVVFKRPLVMGLVYAFFWEIIMVNIPMNVQQITGMYYIRSILLGFSEIREYLEIEEKYSIIGSVIVLSAVTVIFLVLGSIAFSRKDIH